MTGFAISNYLSSTTTVTTTTLLSPITGPMPYSYKLAKVDIAYSRFHMETMPSQGQSPYQQTRNLYHPSQTGYETFSSVYMHVRLRLILGQKTPILSSTVSLQVVLQLQRLEPISAAHCYLPANNKAETTSNQDGDINYDNNKEGYGGR